MGDHITGITTVAGILAALLDRERTGQGQLVEASLLRSGIYSVGWDLGIQMRFGKIGSVRPRTTEMNPMCNCYAAGDGRWFWLLGVEADRLWPKLCEAIDRPDLLTDERFSTARGRRHDAAVLVELLDEVFAQSTRDELTERFDRHDVWWAPVNTPAEVLADPQAIAAGAFVDVPEGEGAPAHRAVATPITFHGRGVAAGRAPCPGLGEHTDEILRGAGFDADRRRALPRLRRHRLTRPVAADRASVELAEHVVHLEAEAPQLVAVQQRERRQLGLAGVGDARAAGGGRRPGRRTSRRARRPRPAGPARRPSGA